MGKLVMNRESLCELIDIKLNEVFLAYQKANGIESGDISPEDAFSLDELQEKMTDLIISVCEKNKTSDKETVERD